MWEQQALLEKYTPRQGPCRDALLPENVNKNRNQAAVPSDHYRVRLLTPHSSALGSDYVDAVWLDGWASRQQIIVTQTPLSDTVEDLWRMIWDQDVGIIMDLQSDAYDTPALDAGLWWPRDANTGELQVGRFLVRRLDAQGRC